MRTRDVERAIRYMEEAWESHVVWADYLEEQGGVGVMGPFPASRASTERKWVRRYELVLRLLREAAS